MDIRAFIVVAIAAVLLFPDAADASGAHGKHGRAAARYHAPGHRIHSLPAEHVQIAIGGVPYFFSGGVYYRHIGGNYVTVTAPIGAVIGQLPRGHRVVRFRGQPYYLVNNSYYFWDPNVGGYVVIADPRSSGL